jgi:hypothetical protein
MPLYGCWIADAVLTRSAPLVDAGVTLVLAGLELRGFVYRSGDFLGTGSFRIAGGFGGWGKDLPGKYYQNPPGVKLSNVLGDAAREAGESVVLQADSSVGPRFFRRGGVASTVLRQLAKNWWIRPDGKTEVGDRPTPDITSAFDVLPHGSKLALGKIAVATDYPEDWVPGSFFTSPVTTSKQISAVVHRLTPETFRTEVWTQP